MAYLLRAQNTQHLILQSPILIRSEDDFSIKVIGTPSQNVDFWRPLGGNDFNDGAPRVLIFANGRSRLTTSSGVNLEWFPTLDITDITSIEFRRASNTLEFLINDLVIPEWTRTDSSSFDAFKTLLANFGATAPYPCDYKLIEFEINGVITNRYDPTASFGQGVLVDTVGGNNGTPVNFPANFNDALVFYDDGGAVTADADYTVNAPTFTSSASVTLPAPIADSSFALASPTFSASADASLPQPIANGAFSIASPLFSASADASFPQPAANSAFTLNTPTFSATASASGAPSGDLYYLKFDGIDNYVVSATVPTITTNFSLEFYGVLMPSGAGNRILALTNGSEYIGIGVSESAWKIYSLGVTPGQGGAVKYNTLVRLRVDWDGEVLSLYEDNLFVYSVTPTQTAFLNTLNSVIIGAADEPIDFFSDIELYSATITVGGSTQNLYDPSASNGTGQILPDTVGGNDGTLVNFPTDDSQWVQYASAAPSADVSFTLNAPVFTASADAALPQPSASITYNINAPTFAADAAVTLPNPTADVDYTVAVPTFSVDSTVTLPQPTASAALSLPAPTFAASATATEPGFNASVNFTVPAPTFSADAAATLPQPIADANFTITAPTFSVVAIVGGIAIIVDNETNINMPALSTNINAPVLSNNVRI